MSAQSFGRAGRVFVLAALVLVCAGERAPSAQLPPKRPKTVTMEFRETPWSKVFDWLTEATEKPVISTFKMTGSFTYVGPPGKEYTIPEVIALLNEGLLEKGFHLVERDNSYYWKWAGLPAGER